MKNIKHELQVIIIGNGQDGSTSQLKKAHDFLRGNEKASSKPPGQQCLKSEEKIYIKDTKCTSRGCKVSFLTPPQLEVAICDFIQCHICP